MGNKPAPGQGQRGNQGSDRPKGESGATVIVQPYRDGAVMINESKLKEYIRKAGDDQNDGDEQDQKG